jgi:hypothetical protein
MSTKKTFLRSIIRHCLKIFLPIIRFVGHKTLSLSDKPTMPLLGPLDNRQLTMSIDKFIVDLSNCRRLCPALVKSQPVSHTRIDYLDLATIYGPFFKYGKHMK